ncbi:MAG: outer membrane protein assembly factor BamD [Bacteroidetes bacterium]|nr:outer membrane protein assembly factor BamD [Bacteroidota bacterium]
MVHRLSFLAALLVACLAGSGCTGSAGASADSPEEAYQKGMQYFEQGKYDQAAEYLKVVFDFGRTNEFADEAQIYLAQAYFEDGQYLLAGIEFTRFIDLYSTDPRAEEAEVGRIRTYYEVSPEYNLDQTDSERAIAYIRLFMTRYPSSLFMDDIVAMLEELREKLARKQFQTGRLYERRKLFEAAIISYEEVLSEYSTSPFADDALLGVFRAQVGFAENSVLARQADRFQTALDTYDRMIQLFPSSPLLSEAERYYDRAFSGRRSVLGEQASR